MHHGCCISLLKALRLLTLKAAKVNMLDKKNSQDTIWLNSAISQNFQLAVFTTIFLNMYIVFVDFGSPINFFILFTVFNTRQLVAGSHRLQIKAALYDLCYITCTAFVR